MKSPLLSGLSFGRLHLPSLLLPLLTFSVSFPSKLEFPEVLIHQVISSSFILCAMVVFFRTSRFTLVAVGIPLAIILLRFLRLGAGSAGGVIDALYFVPYAILLVAVGTKMVRDHPVLMLRQVVWICGLSVALSLLQIMGVQWAQAVAHLYASSGGTTERYLFVPWTELPPLSTIQVRPTGFAAANNVFSQYLLFFYAFTVAWFVGGTRRFRPPLMWMFIVAFACALTGGKVVVVGVVLVLLASFVFIGDKGLVSRVAIVTIGAYALYGGLFPGVFIANFNIDLFAFNALIRLADLTAYGGVPYIEDLFTFMTQYQTGEYIGVRSVERTLAKLEGETISGVATVYRYLPFLGIAALLLGPLWFTRLRRIRHAQYVDMRKVPVIMMVAVFGSTLGGPFIFSAYFWFFFSFVLYPLSIGLLRNRHPASSDSLRGTLPPRALA